MHPLSEREATGLIASIYEASSDDHVWETIMERMADMVGGSGSAFIRKDRQTGYGHWLLSRFDPEGWRDYSSFTGERNPLTSGIRDLSTGSIVVDYETVPRPTLVRTEFFNEFMRPNDIDSVLGVVLWKQGSEAATLNLTRTSAAGAFEPKHADWLRPFIPHLRAMIEATARLQTARAVEAVITDTVRRAPDGLVMLDQGGGIVFANAAAEAILERGDALISTGGRLDARDPAIAQRLQASIAAATVWGLAMRAGSLSVPRADRKHGYALLICPCRRRNFGVMTRTPVAMVSIVDLEIVWRAPAAAWRDIFNFTQTEAMVGNLLALGSSVKEIASAMDISPHTVRVHLSNMRDKTGTNRQADMVRMLVRVKMSLEGGARL